MTSGPQCKHDPDRHTDQTALSAFPRAHRPQKQTSSSGSQTDSCGVLRILKALDASIQGRDVLIVYDDLTQHARAYRELSLLLRRPPGREAFPGDIFYIHSRMLERATHLCKERGGGSLTALPIIETEAQDISAYIPTNLISITDGQIYLSPTLFELGVLPAVDVAKSVSRVGGKAQRAAYRAVAGDLKLAYAQFEELETFARFGARLDDHTRKVINHGQRIRACLKQPELDPVSSQAQIAILLALTAGLFDAVPLDRMRDAEKAVREAAARIPPEVISRFDTAANLSESDRATVIELARRALVSFQPKPAPKAQTGPAAATATNDKGTQTPEPVHQKPAIPAPAAKPAPDTKPNSNPPLGGGSAPGTTEPKTAAAPEPERAPPAKRKP